VSGKETPPGEYKQVAGWTCRSDFAFCQITLAIAVIVMKLFEQHKIGKKTEIKIKIA